MHSYGSQKLLVFVDDFKQNILHEKKLYISLFADPAATPPNLNFSLCVIETSSFRFCVVYPGMIIDLISFFECVKHWGAEGPTSKKSLSRHSSAPWVLKNI